MITQITLEHALKVLEVVDHGLCSGVGQPIPGKMCVEAAVCYALGEPHGDKPTCVGAAVRRYKIRINDSRWSSDKVRGEGLREIAVCQLGSVEVNQREFAKEVALQIIKQVLPLMLRIRGQENLALLCESSSNLINARAAALKVRAVADAAAYAAAYAAIAAAYVADAAAYAAAYAAAHAAAYAAARADATSRDKILCLAAKIGVDALRKLNCPGVALWDQLNQ